MISGAVETECGRGADSNLAFGEQRLLSDGGSSQHPQQTLANEDIFSHNGMNAPIAIDNLGNSKIDGN